MGEVEGPLELILDLVEKRKLHVSQVSLSQIADEFIAYVKSFEEFPMADSADFILVASTLLLIKSKSLLPTLELSEEEEGSIEDLESRLEEYRRYKELSQKIGKMFGNFLYFAEERKEKLIVFNPSADVSVPSLKNALLEVLRNVPQKVAELPKVAVEKIVSLEEMIESLSQRIRTSIKMSFSDFAKAARPNATGGQRPEKRDFSSMEKAERINVIVSFLAMLELVKQGAVRVNQARHFEDIEMESENISIPTY